MELRSTLEDGTAVLFRPISPDDKQRIADGFARMSPTSRYRRFFRHIDHLSADDLAYLTEVDFETHCAWVAVLPDEEGEPGIGVGRWVRLTDEPDVAEAAVTIIDEYQNSGLGRALLWLSAKSAIERGVRAFRVWVLADNQPVISLLKSYGAEPSRWEDGVTEVSVPLPADVAELDASPAPLILRAVAKGTISGRSDPEHRDRTRLDAEAW